MGCVYLLTCTVNGKQYVGKTIRSLTERINEHSKKSRKGTISNAIKKYGKASFRWEILHDKIQSNEELTCLEIYEIKRLRTQSPNGYNDTPGGDGFDWDDPEFRERRREAAVRACGTPEHREKLSRVFKAHFAKPENRKRLLKMICERSNNEQWRKNHLAAMKKLRRNKEWRANQLLAFKNRKPDSTWHRHHAEAMARVFGKPILCLETKVIYSTAREAWRQTGISTCSLCQHLRGRSKSAGGMHWRYIA